LENTKGLEIKLGTYIDINENCRRTIILSYILLSPYFFHKRWLSLSFLGVQMVLDNTTSAFYR